jgi:alpha-beta hydrolase superfamily lysophospholipase
MSKSLKALLIKSAAALTGLLLVVYGGACGFLFFRQNQLIYKPTATIQNTPTSVGLTYQDVWLPIEKNANPEEKIHGWWIPATSQEKGVVLYFHGAGRNLSAYRGNLKSLHQMGFSVFAIDYRGYGMSQGNFPSEVQIYEDAQLAWNYLTQQRRIPNHRIYLFGVSLGGAIAIDLAQRHSDAAALIVVGSFTSMGEQVAKLGFWMFPIDLILTQKFSSLEKIKTIQMPVLIAHGTADDYIPSWMSQKMYDAAPKPKQLLLIPGIDHGKIGALIAGEEFNSAMQQLQAEASEKK